MIHQIEEYKRRLRDCGDSGDAELDAARAEAVRDLGTLVHRYDNAGVFHDRLMDCKSVDGLAWRRAAMDWMVVCRALAELPGAVERLADAKVADHTLWPYLFPY